MQNTTLVPISELCERFLDCFPDVVQSVDADGRLIYINQTGADLYEYGIDELLGMSIHQLYAPEIMRQVEDGFVKLREEGTLAVAESIIQTKSGERIPVEIRSFGVYDNAGNFRQSFSVIRDIRQLKELQNGLIHANRLAALGELAACVAHDVSNPLSVVKLYSEWLLSDLEGNAADLNQMHTTLTEGIQNIQKSADRIEKLVSHLRNFSRNTETRAEQIDLKAIIEDALFMVAGRLKEKRIAVEKDLPQDACIIIGHETQLEQVYVNLINNAIDALAGIDSPKIEITLNRQPDATGMAEAIYESTISDNGCGMDQRVQDRIFEPFFTTKGKNRGTGLGVSISRNVIRRHGGDVQVVSEADKGTTICFRLPVQVEISDTPPVSVG